MGCLIVAILGVAALTHSVQRPLETRDWPSCAAVRRHIRVQSDSCPRLWYTVRQELAVPRGRVVNSSFRRNPKRPVACDVANEARFTRECGLLLPKPSFYQVNDPECGAGCRQRPPPMPVESCAVVGSGGSLLDSRCGKDIDRHTFVFRTNLPFTDGFERDVGSRLTHAMVNTALTLEMQNAAIAHEQHRPFTTNSSHTARLALVRGAIVVSLGQEQGVRYLAKHMRHPGAWAYFNTSAIWMPNQVYRFRHFETWRLAIHDSRRDSSLRAPSTGMLTVAVAAALCENVYVYGYRPLKPGQPYHYWDKRAAADLSHGHHNFNLEHDVLDILARAPRPAVCIDRRGMRPHRGAGLAGAGSHRQV